MEDELTREEANLEYEQYQNSGTRDDFQTWKLKRYVDARILQVILAIIFGIIFIAIAVKFF